MNLSHVISEFSFGPHFPDMTQPLDYTFEVTKERKHSRHLLNFQNLRLLYSLCRVPVLPPRRSNGIYRPSFSAITHEPIQRYTLYSRLAAQPSYSGHLFQV